jgi:hypothetical protein
MILFVASDVVMVVSMRMAVFWILDCEFYWKFTDVPEVLVAPITITLTMVCNVGNLLPDYKALQSSRQPPS